MVSLDADRVSGRGHHARKLAKPGVDCLSFGPGRSELQPRKLSSPFAQNP